MRCVLVVPILLAAAPAPAQPPAAVPVALYADDGVAGKGPGAFEETVRATPDLTVVRVTAADIRIGKMWRYKALVVPGGYSSVEGRSLGPSGREAVRTFVREGGCYVGICAGCYLAATGFEWSLNLLPARVADYAHWARGTGPVKLEFTAAAKDWLGQAEPFAVCKYANGPILEPLPGAPEPLLPLAYFREEFVPKGGTPGLMMNAPAVVAARFGKGWVVGVSPHPEITEGLKHLVPSAIRWAAAHPPG